MSSIGVAHAASSGMYSLNITMNPGANYERILFASHSGTLADGNWVELSQGLSFDIPSTSFEYVGPNSAEFTRNGNVVNVTWDSSVGQVSYPLTSHDVFLPGMSVNATFWGAAALAGEDVNFTLLSLSSLAEYKEIFNLALYGDLSALRSNLTNSYASSTQTLNVNGDASWVISPDPGAGDYVLLVTQETGASTPWDLYIFSTTFVEVLDYSSTITSSSSVTKGSSLDVDVTLGSGASGSFRYGAVLVKQSALSVPFVLSSDFTLLGTNLTINGELIANGSLADAFISGAQGLDYFSPSQITSILSSVFGSNQISVGITSSTASVVGSTSLGTSGLRTGAYYLFTMVWENSDYIAAFNQTTVTVKAPPSPPPGPPPPPPVSNKKPVADAGPNQTALVGRTIYFSGVGSNDPDGSISTYVWVFGDGGSHVGMNASHIYTAEGEYTVELSVIDNQGSLGTDSTNVTVISLPAVPETGTDEGVDAGSIDHVVDSSEETGTTVTLNTSDIVTVSIVKYTDNPYPAVPTPPNSLPTIVDIFVSNQDSILWPIYVEREYSDSDVEGLDESLLALYYYSDGAWHVCRETGVYPELNIVWANMYEDEMTGSLTLVAQRPPAAEFEVSQIEISPTTVEPGEPVTITVNVSNVGAGAGEYSVTLEIGGIIQDTKNISLEGLASELVSFTVSEEGEGDYTVEVNGLNGNFIVLIPPLPAEFEVSDLTLNPKEIEPEEEVEGSIEITNIGELSGSYLLEVKVDGDVVYDETIDIDAGDSLSVIFMVSAVDVGSHLVEVDGLTDTFEVIAIVKPAEIEVEFVGLSSDDVEPGEIITGTLEVTNVGDITGTYALSVTLDGALIHEEIGALGGGQSRTLTFEVSSEELGSHTIEVAGSTADFTVATPEPPEPEPGISWIWIDLGIIVVIIGVLYYLRKKKLI